MYRIDKLFLVIGASLIGAALFQNCAPAQYGFKGPDGEVIATSCGDASCSTTPLTNKPTVTTILLALGDKAKNQLVANPVSTRFLAETVVRYSSPKPNPKILIVRAKDHNGESLSDTIYIQELLVAYQTSLIDEPPMGLEAQDIAGFDLVWFHNPGYPMSIKKTYETLLAFEEAVVLQGDDMTQGVGFSMTALTGLKFIDNGTSISCNGVTFQTDNNAGEQFKVSLDPERVVGLDSSAVSFLYGNDIDNSEVVSSDVEVLATAVGAPTKCSKSRPTVVRRVKI